MSNKNLIYMVAINHNTSTYKNTEYSGYSINTWKYWCEKNNVDFMLITEHDNRLGKPVWNKELIYERAKDYEKIGVVDSDTMIHWNAPNIFDMYDDEFCGVVDDINLRWLMDSLSVYNKFFPNTNIDIDEYINAGVLFFSNQHLPLFEKLLNLLESIDERYEAEDIQTKIYEIGMELNFDNLKDWFSAFYQVILGQDQGPRLGSFIKFYGIKKTITLLRDKIN